MINLIVENSYTRGRKLLADIDIEKGMHDGHRDRLRDRFVKNGADSIETHEMLEMLLFYSIPRRDTNPIAHNLINRFGSFAGVLEAREEQLMMVNGMTKNAAILIKMILPLYNKYQKEKAESIKLKTASDSGKFLMQYYNDMAEERVTVMCMDSGCRVLGFETVCDGDSSNVVLNMRKLVEKILKYPKTTMVIIAHNHPEGIALPSREDIESTKELKMLLSSMGLNLVDHLIVAGNDYVSMASSANFKKLFQE